MLSREQFGVKALIDNGEGEFLFLLRSEPLPGELTPGWDFPGGRVETDPQTLVRENLIHALIRETKEETGLVLPGPFRYAGSQDFEIEEAWLIIHRTYFETGCPPDPRITLNPKEHTENRWATIQHALDNLQLNPMLRAHLLPRLRGVGGVPTRSQITI